MILEAAVACLARRKGEIYGKKAFQKYMYFLSSRGVPLPLTFRIHHFGPFSRELDEQIEHFEMLGAIQTRLQEGGRSGASPYVVITPGKNADEIVDGAAEFVECYGPVIEDVVRRLPSEPLELELLSTVHFVAESIRALSGSDFSDKKETVSEVLKIKKDKFDESKVSAAFDDLVKWEWLPVPATGESPRGAV